VHKNLESALKGIKNNTRFIKVVLAIPGLFLFTVVATNKKGRKL